MVLPSASPIPPICSPMPKVSYSWLSVPTTFPFLSSSIPKSTSGWSMAIPASAICVYWEPKKKAFVRRRFHHQQVRGTYFRAASWVASHFHGKKSRDAQRTLYCTQASSASINFCRESHAWPELIRNMFLSSPNAFITTDYQKYTKVTQYIYIYISTARHQRAHQNANKFQWEAYWISTTHQHQEALESQKLSWFQALRKNPSKSSGVFASSHCKDWQKV